jgi:hypothetical protein
MLLAADTDTLTGHDIASEATWADKYRDSDRYTTKIRYEPTANMPTHKARGVSGVAATPA